PRPMDSGTDWRNPAVVNDPVKRPTPLADQQLSGGPYEDAGQDATRFDPGCSDSHDGQRATGAIPTSDNALWSANRAQGGQESDGCRGSGGRKEQLGDGQRHPRS